jgi:colicin import membrane protein
LKFISILKKIKPKISINTKKNRKNVTIRKRLLVNDMKNKRRLSLHEKPKKRKMRNHYSFHKLPKFSKKNTSIINISNANINKVNISKAKNKLEVNNTNKGKNLSKPKKKERGLQNHYKFHKLHKSSLRNTTGIITKKLGKVNKKNTKKKVKVTKKNTKKKVKVTKKNTKKEGKKSKKVIRNNYLFHKMK